MHNNIIYLYIDWSQLRWLISVCASWMRSSQGLGWSRCMLGIMPSRSSSNGCEGSLAMYSVQRNSMHAAISAILFLMQEGIQFDTWGWHNPCLWFGLCQHCPHCSHIFGLLCLHCDWWRTESQKGLHHSLSSYNAEAYFCSVECAQCAEFVWGMGCSHSSPGGLEKALGYTIMIIIIKCIYVYVRM